MLPPEGYALDFDGANDYVTAPNHPSLEITGDLTVELWFNADEINATSRLVQFGAQGETEATNTLYLLYLDTSGDVVMLHENGAGVNNEVTFSTNLPVEEWHHLAISRDAAAKTYTLYVDGASIGTKTYANNPTGGGDAILWIARDQSGSLFLTAQSTMCESGTWSAVRPTSPPVI